ncbi:C45 family autoproteolytic acyltransferase/hydolase [Oceanobacillus locisalsi]|uniref:C45 family autoproteolytic acyltransferase/hydrolase n=1 Tax=Oceanobacillus locisalsi TaxID=546107 RepID=A0ABW3NKJ1_9BACI
MTKRKKLQVEVVLLKGNAYDIGLKQGSVLKLDPKWKEQAALQTNENIIEAKKYIKRLSVTLWDEIEGLAAGMDIHINTAIQLFSGYDMRLPFMGCTTMANDSYYVRNYDFNDVCYDARLVLSKPDTGYASIGFSQQVTGRLDGMNEKGLVIGLHMVNEKSSQTGFLATTICRLVLEQCADTKEAISLIQKIPHQYSVNFSIMDKAGNNAVVEVSPEEQVVYQSRRIICTNHFESEHLHQKNRASIQMSLRRKEYLKTLERSKLTPKSMYHIFNNETSPLFFTDYKAYFGTLHTVVYCPEDLSVLAGIGGNSNPYVILFQEWLVGKVRLPYMLEGKIESE